MVHLLLNTSNKTNQLLFITSTNKKHYMVFNATSNNISVISWHCIILLYLAMSGIRTQNIYFIWAMNEITHFIWKKQKQKMTFYRTTKRWMSNINVFCLLMWWSSNSTHGKIQQYDTMPRYNWNIVGSGVKHHRWHFIEQQRHECQISMFFVCWCDEK
jgi:hypothetical protein